MSLAEITNPALEPITDDNVFTSTDKGCNVFTSTDNGCQCAYLTNANVLISKDKEKD
jgi:hypothetical protein